MFSLPAGAIDVAGVVVGVIVGTAEEDKGIVLLGVEGFEEVIISVMSRGDSASSLFSRLLITDGSEDGPVVIDDEDEDGGDVEDDGVVNLSGTTLWLLVTIKDELAKFDESKFDSCLG